jgi:hypothetical protein
MAWVDQRDVAKQHLALATAALERAAADKTVSRDVIDALSELRAMGVALAKLASVEVDDEAPKSR